MTFSPTPHGTPNTGAAGGPPVGVVVITRNRRDRLLATLDHLATLPERPPLLVVDNGSTDGTARAVRERFPQIRVVRLSRNAGALARNVGAAALQTPLVAFSDDDSWWHPGALSEAAGLFGAHPRLGLLAADTLVGPDEEPDPLNKVLATSPLDTEPDLPGTPVLGFLACASVVRRRAFLNAGGFHPVLHFGAEETLLAVDLAAAGWGVTHCPQVVAHHHPDAGARPGRAALVRRNELLTAWLRRPVRYAAAATARLAGEALHNPQARRALLSAAYRLPRALAHRHRVPHWLEHRLRLVELHLPAS